MAQYEFDFESETLDTFPSFLTRRWNTGQPQPVVKSAAAGGLSGLTKALEKAKTSANSRALTSFNAIDADADRANAKIRTVVFTGSRPGALATYTPVWAAVFRASGSSGSETGYAVGFTVASSVYKITFIKYNGGTSTDSQINFSWTDDTWYILESEISGTTTTTIDVSLYAISDPNTPIFTHQYTDSASPIQAAGWIGIGDFAYGDSPQSQHSKIQVATGASSLPPLTGGTITKGVTLQLFDGASNVGALTDIQAAFFDQSEPGDFLAPVFKTKTATTNSSGQVTLNVDAETSLSVGQNGCLVLYKLDGTDHRLSPALVTRATIVDIA